MGLVVHNLNERLKRYVGIPHKVGGASFEETDCWGLVWLFYKHEFGIELPRYHGPPDVHEIVEVSRIVIGEERDSGRWQLIEPGKEQFGDVVDIMFLRVVHVGIWIAPRRMLHAMGKTGSIVEDMGRLQWRHSVRGCYRRA